MCQRSGTLLLAIVFIGLGVLNCAYPSDISQKTLKYYSGFLPFLAVLKLNIVLGVTMFLTSTALLLGKSHASCLVQTVMILHIASQGIPYIPTLDTSEQFGALFTLIKCVGILGASLLIAK